MSLFGPWEEPTNISAKEEFTLWELVNNRKLVNKPFRVKESDNFTYEFFCEGTPLTRLIDETLGSGNLMEVVTLPLGEDLNEWLAANTVDFFNQVNVLYVTLTEFCTTESCLTMTAGPKYEFWWADGVRIKKPIQVSAPKYVYHLMDWIGSQLDDESIFPLEFDNSFLHYLTTKAVLQTAAVTKVTHKT